MIGPRFTDDHGEIATNPPPIRAALLMGTNRGYEFLNFGTF